MSIHGKKQSKHSSLFPHCDIHINTSQFNINTIQQRGDKRVEERRTLKPKQLERILISLLLYNRQDNFEMIQRNTKG